MKTIITAIIFLTVGILTACSSSTENATAGKPTTEIKQANSTKPENPKTEKTNIEAKQQVELPEFKKHEDYRTSVREKMLKAGWTPARSEDEGKENCLTDSKVCQEFPELEGGPSSPLGQTILRWKKGDKIVLIHTIDNFLFDRYEFEQKQTTPSLAGKYLYKSKHEYGFDTFLLDLRAGNKAVYQIEQEGRDGADLKGTWVWNEAKATLTVALTTESGEQDVFVFKLQGKDLKMTEDSRSDVGYAGFTGKVFKKQ